MCVYSQAMNAIAPSKVLGSLSSILLSSRLDSSCTDITGNAVDTSMVSAMRISDVDLSRGASSSTRVNTRRMSARDFFADLDFGNELVAAEEKTTWELLLATAASVDEKVDQRSNTHNHESTRAQDVVLLGHGDGYFKFYFKIND